MRTIQFAVIAGVCALGMLGGCSNITMLRVEELKQIESRVDSLKVELSALQLEMIKEQKKQNELLRLIRADQQVRFSELERSTNALAGSVSESSDRLSKIDRKTQEIKKRWEQKAMADSMQDASVNAEIENLFQIAHADFSAGRYEVAQAGFADLVKRFPDALYAEGASYWVGECLYVQKKYPEAEKTFMAYIKKYPDGKKMCVALFKLGLVYEGMKKQKAQDMVWRQLIQLCPDSEEAAAAKARQGQ